MTKYTTLNKIKAHDPCSDSWEKALKLLGKTKADDDPILFTNILDKMGLDDAIWTLITHEDQNKVRLFACDCAEHVLHLYEDKHDSKAPRKAIETARLYAKGDATKEELAAAGAAAWDAAGDAAGAAAGAAARAAARAAAGDAARAAARDDEREWQKTLFREYFG
ncbi:MAG: hypothetical protein V3R25_05710 [Nitrosomonadaceae bacterium]